MYRATEAFHDAQDRNHWYQKGDTYPQEGLHPSQERITELSGTKNRRGIPLIEEVTEEPAAEPAAEAAKPELAPAQPEETGKKKRTSTKKES